jgi:uncharacterized membrane protein
MIAPLGLGVYFVWKEVLWFKVLLVSIMVKGFVVFLLRFKVFIVCSNIYILFIFFYLCFFCNIMSLIKRYWKTDIGDVGTCG